MQTYGSVDGVVIPAELAINEFDLEHGIVDRVRLARRVRVVNVTDLVRDDRRYTAAAVGNPEVSGSVPRE